MDILTLAKDPNLANGGVWHNLDETTRIKVAKLNNPRFLEAVRARIEEAKTNGVGELTEDEKERITLEAMAEGVLVDWEGFTLGGEEYPYSYENALKLLSAPQLADLKETVSRLSIGDEIFRSQQVEEDLKKLLAS